MTNNVSTFNVAIVGSPGVGKRKFTGDNPVTTYTINEYEGSRQVRISLLTSNEASSLPHYHIDAVILMYSLTDNGSFEDMDTHYKSTVTSYPNRLMMLVGNKSDNLQREVSTVQAREFATERGMLFAEVSSASGRNVAESMKQLATELARRQSEGTLLGIIPSPKQNKMRGVYYDLFKFLAIAAVGLGLLGIATIVGVGYLVKYLIWG